MQRKYVVSLWLEAFLPDGFDAVAEVVEDVTAGDAATCREEAADNAGDVVADVELLRIIDTYTLHAKTETADARENHRLAIRELFLEKILQFCDDTDDRTLRETAVATGLGCNLVERYLTLTD
jgi:hypothetical protein